MDTHLQMQEMFFAGKLVREGLLLTVGEPQVLGCVLRGYAELYERHGGPVPCK